MLYRQSLLLAQALGDRLEISFEVQGVAMSLAGLGDPELTLRLAAPVMAEWERIGVDLHIKFWDALIERYLGGARNMLGAEAADHIYEEGRLIPFECAVAVALKAGSSHVEPGTQGTPREHSVEELQSK